MPTKHRATVPDVAVALPIVPMLDLSFQILFFFMITFNPSKAEGKMAMNLPATGQAKAKDDQSVDLSKPPDIDLEIPADFVVVVRSHENDSFSLALRTAEKSDEIGTARGLSQLSARERQAEVDKLLDKLRAELEKRLKEKKARDDKAADNVKIEANGKTKYALIVGVMDACIKAGYAQVGFAPPPDQNP